MDKIDITDSAQEYLSELLSKQEDPTNIKIFVSEPGTPKA
jgi:Fe/S biogenesis protein NfuA